jgi:hypothetical protein
VSARPASAIVSVAYTGFAHAELPALCQRDHAELQRRPLAASHCTVSAAMSTETLAETLGQSINTLIGTPEELLARIAEFARPAGPRSPTPFTATAVLHYSACKS